LKGVIFFWIPSFHQFVSLADHSSIQECEALSGPAYTLDDLAETNRIGFPTGGAALWPTTFGNGVVGASWNIPPLCSIFYGLSVLSEPHVP